MFSKYFKSFLCLAVFISALVFCRAAHAASTTWAALGNPGFSDNQAIYTSLAIDASNTPYVAYSDGAVDLKVTVKKYAGGDWVDVGTPGFSEGGVYYPFMAIDASNTPYVAYMDVGRDNVTIVKKYDGQDWVEVGTPFSEGETDYVTLAFDSSNTPYMAYRDNDSKNDMAIVLKYDGNDWVSVGNPDFSHELIGRISLAIDASNTPYVAYEDNYIGGLATVKKYDGNDWVDVGTPGFSTGQPAYISLAIDASNTPYVAYSDGAVDRTAMVKKYDGQDWADVGTPGFSIGEAYYVSLAIDASNTPYVAYMDLTQSGKATVKKYDGSDWVDAGNAGFSSGTVAYVSLALDSNNNPYVSYSDNFNGDEATVSVLAPAISCSGNFTESIVNDGTVNGTRTATIINDVFVDASSTLTEGVHYVLSHKPAGLVPTMTVSADGSQASLSFSGYATDNTNADDVDDLTITFLDGAFADNPTASKVLGYSNNKGAVDFYTNSPGFWQILGDPGFSEGLMDSISLDLDASGTPYIAYNDWAHDNKVTVMKYNGSSWISTGSSGFSDSGTNSYVPLALDANDVPCIAYQSLEDSKITVMKYDSGDEDWDYVGPPSFSNEGAIPLSLVFDASNTPYLSYIDGSNDNQGVVVRYNNGDWEAIGTSLPNYLTYALFGFGASNTPYIALSNNDNRSVTVMKYDGNDWVGVGDPDFSGEGTGVLDFALDASGTPYVSFLDYNNRASVMRYDGNNWVYVGDPEFTESATSPALEIDSDGTPYLAFSENDYGNTMTVMKYDGNDWVDVGGRGFSSPQTTLANIGFSLDAQGLPYVVYEDTMNDGKATAMKYAVSPSQITDLAASSGNTKVTLSWTIPTGTNGVADIADYLIKYKLISGETWSVFSHTPFASNSVNVTGLSNGSAYDFQVSAVSAEGVNSNHISASATPDAPPAPVPVIIHYGGGSSWLPPVPPVVPPVITPTSTEEIVVLPSVPTKPAGSEIKKYKFSKTLKLGMNNKDVKELQKYLNANGFIIAKFGPGSPGKETTFFGWATQMALIKFQQKNRITPASGVCGPLTIAFINKSK